MFTQLDSEYRQRKTLRFLLIAILLTTIALAILLVAFDRFFDSWFPQYEWAGEAQIYTHIGVSVILTVSLVLLLLNRAGGTASAVARYSFVTMMFVAAVISDTPRNVVGRGLIVFSLPIMLSSVLLGPAHSFVTATISSLIISIIDTLSLGNIPNPFAILTFYVIALISWLATRLLEEAIQDAQELNKKLNEKVEAQHQELLQIVNDFAFLADGQQNAIELYGPDKELVFANGRAIHIRERLDDEAHAVRQNIVNKAWKKNLYTRVEFPAGFQVDITSSLIDTEGGTFLLLQAIRLPDGESKRSLEDWQQQLAADTSLPENAEYNPYTRKMRAISQKSGRFRRKVLFELDTDYNLVIENPFSRQQKFRFSLAHLWSLVKRGESQREPRAPRQF
jgi:hypothetical protein